MDSIIIFGAKYLFIFVVLIWLWVWWQSNRKNRTELAISTIGAGILAAVLDKVSAKLYYDPRPFVTHHLKPLVGHATDNGFPSEHTLLTITLATVLLFYRPKLAWLAFGLALLVGIARIAAHIHSPVDIFGGIVFGLIAGYGGHYLAQRLRAKPISKSSEED